MNFVNIEKPTSAPSMIEKKKGKATKRGRTISENNSNLLTQWTLCVHFSSFNLFHVKIKA